MTASALSSDDTEGSGPLPGTGPSADVPEWLAQRRQRAEPTKRPINAVESTEKGDATPPPISRPKQLPRPPVLAAKLEKLVLTTDQETKPEAQKPWLSRWISSHTTIGILVSLLVHTVILSILALILISKVTSNDGIALWGILGDSQELGTESVLDTSLPSDGGESATLEIASVSQALESIGTGSPIPEPIRMGLGGKGSGEGESGDGVSIGVASPKVPGYAQSKGHFSAWTEPRDPKPKENYFIVVQLRLPARIKKYRGSDLSGLVTGTDAYKQMIRFKASEQFDVDEGAVEVRIMVPGGDVRVRDTIQLESKILHEKQTFEIEF